MTDATAARAALADRLETFASSLWSSPWSSRDAVLVLEAVEMLRSPIAAPSPALEPDDEAASLLERLRNPQWVHGSVPFESPQLDKEQTVADMAEAAWMIDALCNAIEIERRAAPSGEPDTNWKDDPSSDERWNAGLDFGMRHFCYALGVDPKAVRWDAATETLDGDVIAVIWNILREKMGEDWDPDAAPASNAKEDEA